MKIKLRKKPPFTCRHVDPTTGTLDHFDHALAESDGEMCPTHTKIVAEARERFFNPPAKEKREEPAVVTRRIWP